MCQPMGQRREKREAAWSQTFGVEDHRASNPGSGSGPRHPVIGVGGEAGAGVLSGRSSQMPCPTPRPGPEVVCVGMALVEGWGASLGSCSDRLSVQRGPPPLPWACAASAPQPTARPGPDPTSPRLQHKQGKVGPDGKELIPHESPRVGGFGFVATPSPAPGERRALCWGGGLPSWPRPLLGLPTPRGPGSHPCSAGTEQGCGPWALRWARPQTPGASWASCPAGCFLCLT